MTTQFEVGQRVVCVDGAGGRAARVLKEGQVYTVRWAGAVDVRWAVEVDGVLGLEGISQAFGSWRFQAEEQRAAPTATDGDGGFVPMSLPPTAKPVQERVPMRWPEPFPRRAMR